MNYRFSNLNNRAVFLDRDGVVNRRLVGDYVKHWEEFEFLPEIFSTLPEMHQAGFLVLLVTNQRGVARELMSREDVEEIHRRMQAELRRRCGHEFDAIYYCPHDMADACDCRKPLPGMILRGASEHSIDPVVSWMIGDSESDIEAGIAAGCRTVRIDPDLGVTAATLIARSLDEAWASIRKEPLR